MTFSLSGLIIRTEKHIALADWISIGQKIKVKSYFPRATDAFPLKERKIEFGMHVTERGTHEGKGEGVFQVSVIINYEINHASYLKPLLMVVSGVDLKFYT